MKFEKVMLKRNSTLLLTGLCSVFITKIALAQQAETSISQPNTIASPWAKNLDADHPLPEYPRPQLQRKNWQNLNGKWQYTISSDSSSVPSTYDGTIIVPFALESALSGVKKPLQPSQVLWYKRNIDMPAIPADQDFILQFGAVDFKCSVYLNGKLIGAHQGGYTHFSCIGTAALIKGNNELVVKVIDPTNEGFGPHGKQTLNPANIYYTASSGIWQTVWAEWLPKSRLETVSFQTDVDHGHVEIIPVISGTTANMSIAVSIFDDGKQIIRQSFKPTDAINIALKTPKYWSPETPHLYDVTFELKKGGKTVDEVKSYFGMRKVEVKKDGDGIERIFLNNEPYYNLGVLDQGYWPDGIYTAPTDEALRFDIAITKNMGFNTIRKHIKIEPDRWYYYADKLGVLVWQDFVNPNQGLPVGSKEEFEAETKETIAQLKNHPCITTWVVFNEKWGQYDQQRVTEMVKALDGTRLVNGHSGEYLYVNNQLRSPSEAPYISSDLTDVHSYPYPRPGYVAAGKAMVLGEFGGIGVPIGGHIWNDWEIGWGYDGMGTIDGLEQKYSLMTDSLFQLKKAGLSGSIYTQPFDVEGEQNGLITYDRKVVKVPIDRIRAINARLYSNKVKEVAVAPQVKPQTGKEVQQEYATAVKQYMKGIRDSAFLRNLAARTINDKRLLRRVMNDYVSVIKAPLADNNLQLLLKTADTTADAGFQLIFANHRQLSAHMDSAKLINYLRKVIGNEIKGYIGVHTNQGIDTLKSRIIQKYGEVGEREFLASLAFYYFSTANYMNFAKVKSETLHKYPTEISIFDLNNDAWFIFAGVKDKELLNEALSWSKIVIAKEPTANYYDTYANILYKLGKQQEAIKVQEKALTLDPGNGIISDIERNLQLMKEGKPTW
jgi:tetratricopeptide (TPR) repeat protein